MHKSSAAPSSHRAVTLSNVLLAGYLFAVTVLVLLWAGVYGPHEGASASTQELRRCAALQDAAQRLACFDNATPADTRLPGRGFAP